MPLIPRPRSSSPSRLPRWLAVAGAAGCMAWAAGCDAADLSTPRLPARNLLVEVRQGDAGSLDAQGGGVQGGVTVYSDGRITGQAAGGWSVRTERSGSQSVQQVTVVNGGRASLRLGQQAPLQWWSVFVTPQGVQAVPTTQWVEAGQGFSVRPSWPGEGSPVTVELDAKSTRLMDGGSLGRPDVSGTGTEGVRTSTTVQLPLNQWVTIASTSQGSSRQAAGTVSTRQAAGAQQVWVQMRVTLQR